MSVYNIYTFNMNAVQEYGHVIINKYISSGTVYKSGVLYIYLYSHTAKYIGTEK